MVHTMQIQTKTRFNYSNNNNSVFFVHEYIIRLPDKLCIAPFYCVLNDQNKKMDVSLYTSSIEKSVRETEVLRHGGVSQTNMNIYNLQFCGGKARPCSVDMKMQLVVLV